MEVINTLKSIDLVSWVILFTLLMIVIGLYIKRSSPYVKDIVTNAIIEAEKHFNSGEGQLKLKFAVTKIRESLPLILRVFITHRMLVTMIETTLNKISDSFELDKKVDIIGNEIIIPKKIIIEKKNKDTSIEIGTMELNKDDSDIEMYANLKAKTNWKDDTETSVEVGIKKKL